MTGVNDSAALLAELRGLRELMEERRRKADERYEADKTWKAGHDELHRVELIQVSARLKHLEDENSAIAREVANLRSTADKGDGALRVLLWSGGFIVGLTAIVTSIWNMLHGQGD